jgi:hypothetical protein
MEKKNYAITTRVKKWYWALYTWFLNISMVQAWRLYRAHMAEKFRLEEEAEANAQMQASVSERKEMEKMRKRRRTAERRRGEIPLLEFIRQVVDMLFKKHSCRVTARFRRFRMIDCTPFCGRERFTTSTTLLSNK